MANINQSTTVEVLGLLAWIDCELEIVNDMLCQTARDSNDYDGLLLYRDQLVMQQKEIYESLPGSCNKLIMPKF